MFPVDRQRLIDHDAKAAIDGFPRDENRHEPGAGFPRQTRSPRRDAQAHAQDADIGDMGAPGLDRDRHDSFLREHALKMPQRAARRRVVHDHTFGEIPVFHTPLQRIEPAYAEPGMREAVVGARQMHGRVTRGGETDLCDRVCKGASADPKDHAAPVGDGGSQPIGTVEPDGRAPVRSQKASENLKAKLEPLGLELFADPVDGSPVDRVIAGKCLLNAGSDGLASRPTDGGQAGENTTDGGPVPCIDERSYWNQPG